MFRVFRGSIALGLALSGWLLAVASGAAAEVATNLVWISPGTFTMGWAPGENVGGASGLPRTQVTLPEGYWMGRYEVTAAEFSSVMGYNPGFFTNDLRLPVHQVSWAEALAYCDRLNQSEGAAGRLPAGFAYRLPTEAEWEYACRAGTTTIFSFGTNETDLANYAWVDGNSGGVPHPVGEKLPNPWGLYDMHGNAWEWCLEQFYSDYPGGSVTNWHGANTGSLRIFRGGAWNIDARGNHSSVRGGNAPDLRAWNTGFRVALAKDTRAALPPPSPNLVWISPGTFTMGSPPSESGLFQYSNAVPPHPVTLTGGFWMSKYEVTQGEYASLMNTNPSAFRGDDQGPVEQVSWFDATEYCQRLTDTERAAGRLPVGYVYRLPTEAEWEYACRAGTTTRWSFGDNSVDLGSYAWHYGNSGCNPLTNDCSNGSTRAVGLKLPNPWGLYDMHGNVGEWVLDWHGPYTSISAIDPGGPATGTVRSYRGPGWDFGDIHSRSSSRWPFFPGNRDNSIGFRVVLAEEKCTAAPASLLSWWPGNGSAIDATGPNHGTMQNGARFSPGRVGQAFSFDGVNDHVAIPSLDLSAGNAITIEAWIKPVNITTNRYYEIIRQQSAGLPPDWIFSFQEFGTILSFGLSAGGSYGELDVAIAPAAFVDGNWHHIAATYDGLTKRVYRDGVEIGSAAKTGTVNFAGTHHAIGAWRNAGGSAEHFNGLIDELAIFNRGLNASEIAAIYAAGSAGMCASSNRAILYATAFEGTIGPEWSRTNISTTPSGGRRFLGEFGNQTVTLKLTNLPAHTSVLVSFDLFLIRSWDGNWSNAGPDQFSVVVNQQSRLRTTFNTGYNVEAGQAYPGVFPGSSFPANTGAAETNSLGYQFGGRAMDAVYHIALPFNHELSEFVLNFSAYGLQALADESWGLDNVTIQIEGAPTTPSSKLFAVEPGAVWKYLDDGSNQGTNWIAPGFNDSAWASGPAELGFGDNNPTDQRPEAAVIRSNRVDGTRILTYYFRRAFVVSNVWAMTNLTLGLLRDDGGVVYLNGAEVFRGNLPPGPVSYLTQASAAASDDGTVFYTTALSPSLLVEGTNLLAVEIHQNNTNSSDLSFDLYLAADLAPCHPSFLALTNPVGTFTLERDAVAFAEEGGALQVNVRRLGGSTGAASVTCQAIDGSAVAGLDFASSSVTLDFADGQTVRSFSVPIVNDTQPEDDETFTLRLTAPTGGANLAGCTNLAVTILDDEGVIELAQTNLLVAELSRFVYVPIRWTGGTNRSVSVNVLAVSGSAQATNDFVPHASVVTFAPGESILYRAVEIRDDLSVEGDETFSFVLSSTSARPPLGGATNATITILDNDAPGNVGRGANEGVLATAVQPDGKALIGGLFTALNGEQFSNVTILRLNTNGLRDTTFTPAALAPNHQVYDLRFASDGKILVSGYFTSINGTARMHVARLNANGTLDTSFAPLSGANSWVNGIAEQPGGKIIITGDFTAYDGVPAGHIARLNPNGTLDTNFNSGTGFNLRYVGPLAVLTNGQILVSGFFQSYNGTNRNNLVRLNPDGGLDLSFNTGGSGPEDTTSVIKVLSDGRILIGGVFRHYNGVPRDKLARLLPDGQLDPTFLPNWVPNWDSGEVTGAQPDAIEVQSDGKIIVVGRMNSPTGNFPSYIGRLHTNGQVDLSFKVGSGANSWIYSVRQLPDQRLLIGGLFTVFNGFNRYRFAYLNTDGSLPDEPVNWVQWPSASGGNGHWYALTSRPNNWTNAEAEAVANRGHLVSVNDAAEQSFLETTFLKGLNRVRPFWIGLSDAAGEGTFVWSNGEPFGYANWDLGQPDNANGTEDFVAMNWWYSWNLATTPNPFGAWNDIPHVGYLPGSGSMGMPPYFGIMETTNNPLVPPVITVQPQSQATVVGGNATFFIEATGATPIHFRWRRGGATFTNGIIVSTATNSTLTLTNVSAGDNGARFTVVVTNIAGVAPLSSPAILTVLAPPNILIDGQPVAGGSVIVTNAATVAFSTIPTNAVLFYTLDGAPPGTGPLFNGPFLVDRAVTVRAIAYTAGYTHSAEAGPVQLTVVSPPLITAQPQGRVALAGETVELSVTASGTAPLSYQWFFNGASVPGGAGPALVRANAQPAHSGDYFVVVSNPYGAAASAIAQVTVLFPPGIITQPASTNVPPGASVTFCVGATGTGPLRYQWRRNGADIPSATNECLTIAPVQPSDGGLYTVVVENGAGAVTSDPAELVVNVPLVPPGDNFAERVAIAGATNDIRASNLFATREAGEPFHAGKPGSNSVWYAWTAPASGVARFRTSGSGFDTLLAVYAGASVSNLTELASDEDQGRFYASEVRFNASAGVEYIVAIDGLGGQAGGFVLSWELEATLETVPRITVHPTNQVVGLGGSAVFAVEAEGQGLAFQWLRNGAPIANATNATLVLTSVQPADLGGYAARASSGSRSVVSQPATLEIGGSARVPSQDKIEDLFFSGQGAGSLFGGVGRKDASGAAASSSGGFASVSVGASDFRTWNNTLDGAQQCERNHCGVRGGHSRWLRLKPSGNATLVLDTLGSEIDTVLAVYTNSSLQCDSFREVQCDNDGALDGVRSRVKFPALQGADYYVAVDGVNGEQGLVTVNWSLGHEPMMTSVNGPQTVLAGESLALSVTVANANPPPTFQWWHNDVPMGGANGPTLTLEDVDASQSGRYRVTASNSVGAAVSPDLLVTVVTPLEVGVEAEEVQGAWQLRLKGTVRRGVMLQATTNFLHWIPVYTNAVPSAPLEFMDAGAPVYPLRFYRLAPWP